MSVVILLISLIYVTPVNAANDGWNCIDGRYCYRYADGTWATSEYVDGYWLDGSCWYDSKWNGHWAHNNVGWWFRDDAESAKLRDDVNKVLAEMHKDGTVARITEKFFYEDMTQFISDQWLKTNR